MTKYRPVLCGRCGHGKAAHHLQPQPVLCTACAARKETKLNARHPFFSEVEAQIR